MSSHLVLLVSCTPSGTVTHQVLLSASVYHNLKLYCNIYSFINNTLNFEDELLCICISNTNITHVRATLNCIHYGVAFNAQALLILVPLVTGHRMVATCDNTSQKSNCFVGTTVTTCPHTQNTVCKYIDCIIVCCSIYYTIKHIPGLGFLYTTLPVRLSQVSTRSISPPVTCYINI